MVRLKDVASIGVIIVIAGIALAVGDEILDQFKTNVRDTTSVTNESVTITAGVGSIANDWVVGQLSECYNNSASSPTTYTIPGLCNVTERGTVSCGGAATSAVNISYNYDNRNIAVQAVENASEGILELGTWLPTIGLVIAAALIITIVFTSFGKGQY